MTDPASLRAAVRGCRRVFHAAADYRLWTPRPAELYRTNVEGTRTLLNLRKPDQKFVFASTGSIYGSIPDYICNEETPRANSSLADAYSMYAWIRPRNRL